MRPPRKDIVIADEDAKIARFESNEIKGFRWRKDNSLYSLSGLTKKICEQYGNFNLPTVQGLIYWAKQGETEPLLDVAKSLQSQVSAEE